MPIKNEEAFRAALDGKKLEYKAPCTSKVVHEWLPCKAVGEQLINSILCWRGYEWRVYVEPPPDKYWYWNVTLVGELHVAGSLTLQAAKGYRADGYVCVGVLEATYPQGDKTKPTFRYIPDEPKA